MASLLASYAASCCGALACSGFRLIGTSITSSSARAAYCSFFALSLIIQWILRYQAKPLIEKMPCAFICAPSRRRNSRRNAWSPEIGRLAFSSTSSSGILRHTTPSIPETWYGDQAVYRVSLGNFLFFALLSLSLLGVRDTGDRRHR